METPEAAHGLIGGLKKHHLAIFGLIGAAAGVAYLADRSKNGSGQPQTAVIAGATPGDTSGGGVSQSVFAAMQDSVSKEIDKLTSQETANVTAQADLIHQIQDLHDSVDKLTHPAAPPPSAPPAPVAPVAAAFDWVGAASQLDAYAMNIVRSKGKLTQEGQNSAWDTVFGNWDESKRRYVQWHIGNDFGQGLIRADTGGTDHNAVGTLIEKHATDYDKGKY